MQRLDLSDNERAILIMAPATARRFRPAAAMAIATPDGHRLMIAQKV
jgi:hypothetical protein